MSDSNDSSPSSSPERRGFLTDRFRVGRLVFFRPLRWSSSLPELEDRLSDLCDFLLRCCLGRPLRTTIGALDGFIPRSWYFGPSSFASSLDSPPDSGGGGEPVDGWRDVGGELLGPGISTSGSCSSSEFGGRLRRWGWTRGAEVNPRPPAARKFLTTGAEAARPHEGPGGGVREELASGGRHLDAVEGRPTFIDWSNHQRPVQSIARFGNNWSIAL